MVTLLILKLDHMSGFSDHVSMKEVDVARTYHGLFKVENLLIISILLQNIRLAGPAHHHLSHTTVTTEDEHEDRYTS